MLYADERPQTFDEVKEQEFIIKNLQSQAKKGVFFNSIILCGKYGTGKTTVARIIARAANCENRDENGNPCMECASCRSILDKSGTDVIEIDGASNNGVDAARKLMKEINYVPMSKYKVIIIDECHRISSSAWDALLKTLEEPPKHAIFILCTTDETALPETIRSRAPIYRFESISAGMLSRHARETAIKHGIKISDNALNLLASYADGSMRNMLSLLEQISMQGSDINEDDVEMLLGINHYTFTVEFISAMLSGKLNTCMKLLNSLISEGRSVRLFSKDIMRTAVDMVLLKTGIMPDNGNMEYIGLLKEETTKHSMAQLNRLAETASDLEKRMRKESDTYAMYGGIISSVRKLQKDAGREEEETAKNILQPKKETAENRSNLTAQATPVPTSGPVQKPDTESLKQAGITSDGAANDGISRNICVLPDLEQALMDFMPDLKRKPQGRFDTGMPENAGSMENNGVQDSTVSIETDAGLADGTGKYEDYSQPYGRNGFIHSPGIGYGTVPDIPDNGKDNGKYDADGYAPNHSDYGRELSGGEDDFTKRWEKARQNIPENQGFMLPPLNSPAAAKGFNVFGLPLGLGVPDMGRKQSFT